MKFHLPKVYPITDTSISQLSHVEQVQLLINGSAKIIQLREKHSSSADFYEQAKRSVEIARESKVKIIINDRVDIALAVKADGVHLGQDDLSPEHARKILGSKAIIGFSTHNVDQAAAALHFPVDYIAIGPVFSTSTKSNPDPTVGLDGVKRVRNKISDFPLVAIGGIKFSNIAEVFESGANSVALISDLLSNPEMIGKTIAKFSA